MTKFLNFPSRYQSGASEVVPKWSSIPGRGANDYDHDASIKAHTESRKHTRIRSTLCGTVIML